MGTLRSYPPESGSDARRVYGYDSDPDFALLSLDRVMMMDERVLGH